LSSEKLLGREYSNESLIQRASTDYLTGLKTRRFFEEQLDRELKRAERNRSALAVVMIDIDHFKQVNDRFGHLAGDALLRQLSSTLNRDLREIDTLARYGGEEFVLLLPDTQGSGAVHLAERLRKNVEDTEWDLGSPEKVRLTISLGVSSFPDDAQSNIDLLATADAALYEAKHTGRNRVVSCPELKPKQERRSEKRLRHALPVQVCGMDVEGNMFAQETTTLDISKRGARVHGFTNTLEIGDILAIQHENRRARFRIAWLGAVGTPVASQVGLQLIDETKQLWQNIESPPSAN
jgi:diguanylate cyclase (GGDEF)-like protein